MMNKSQILKKIGNIIEELGEQQQYLAGASKINLLELELFTANADFLIDHIEILKKLNDKRFEAEEQEEQVVAPQQKTVIQMSAENIVKQPAIGNKNKEEPKQKFNFSFDEPPTEMIFDFEKQIAVEETFDRPLNEDEIRLLEQKSSAPVAKAEEFIILDEEVVEEEEGIDPYLIIKDEYAKALDNEENVPKSEIVEQLKHPDKVSETIAQPSPIYAESEPISASAETVQNTFHSDSFIPKRNEPSPLQDEKPLTLNEMLSAKLSQGSAYGSARQGKKLDDLKAGISINDKMVFIKELFNGYNLAYSEAIEIVNRFDSYEAADNFLQKNYSVKNDWESKQITVARFYEYLHKKFII